MACAAEVLMPARRRGAVAILCLGFTLAAAPRPGRAEESRSTTSAVVRGGTIVGQSTFAGDDYTTLGGAVALGARAGRLGAEVEYDYLTLQSHGPASEIVGDGHRIAVNARLDVIRVHRWLGSAAVLTLWTEVGLGRQWTSWRAAPAPTPAGAGIGTGALQARTMDTLASAPERIDTTAGFGWLLDHRSAASGRWPRWLGWVVGWRFTAAPGLTELPALGIPKCSGAGCRPPPSMDEPDLGLLFHSSLVASW
jgi:hypothetical protein